jgi:hypothetical protein
MKLTNEEVYKKFVVADEDRCDLCFDENKECTIIKFNWFSKKKLCESCISKLFRSLRKDK